ncbi:MAG: hypothetical protein AAFU85_08550 [Planctomycetota bacterium]
MRVFFFVAGVVLALAFAFKRSSDVQPASDPPELLSVERSFAEQLADGRAGRTDRIELVDTQLDAASVSALSADDDWLETLILDAGVVADEGAATIATLPSLIHLRLRESPLTDEGLRLLGECRSIRILNLPQCAATSEGIRALSKLPSLRSLRLGGPRFDADAAQAIAALVSLRQIHLIGVPIDDAGLRAIANLPKLQSLYVDDGKVSEAGWDWLLDTYPGLHIHVNQQHIDREQKEHAP